MHTVICGDGPMGRALADELTVSGHGVVVLGRPPGPVHPASAFDGADVVHEFSVAAAVADNTRAALEGGCRRIVIGTTGWTAERDGVDRLLTENGAAAVVAPTFSPGAAVLMRLASDAAAALGRLGGYDPYIVEWHRAGKRDRPSGTALELARRLIRGHPVKRRIGAAADGPADPEALEVLSLRAGAAPGTHLVGFDATGETLELRLTARDRRSYASGARLAGDWLAATHRAPGIHPFESVIDDLIATLSPERIPA
ncbi:MAG: 4-hydroxy-tetrahydrodipicolinate reductase [Candidatus Limnocylindria bacterium]